MGKLNVDVKVAVYDKNRMITVTTGQGRLMISYDKKVAFIDKQSGRVSINTRWYGCSKTTMKHLTAFLGEGMAQVDEKLDSGEYIAVEDMACAA